MIVGSRAGWRGDNCVGTEWGRRIFGQTLPGFGCIDTSVARKTIRTLYLRTSECGRQGQEVRFHSSEVVKIKKAAVWKMMLITLNKLHNAHEGARAQVPLASLREAEVPKAEMSLMVTSSLLRRWHTPGWPRGVLSEMQRSC